MLLDGKVAIVTGASQGIGAACAERLGREGARVVLCDVNTAQGQSTAADIAKTGAKASFVACDVSKATDVAKVVAAVDAPLPADPTTASVLKVRPSAFPRRVQRVTFIQRVPPTGQPPRQ